MSAQTDPAHEVLKQQLVLDTVLYMPIEFDSSTTLSIHLVVNKKGADVGDYASTLSLDSRRELADAVVDIESLAAAISGGKPGHGASGGSAHKSPVRSPDSARKADSKKPLSMVAHSMPNVNGSTTPRAFTLDELNDLTGPGHSCCSAGCLLFCSSVWCDDNLCGSACAGTLARVGTEDTAEWFTETLHFAPPLPSPSSSRGRHKTTEMIRGAATAKVSLRLYSCVDSCTT